MVTLLLLASCTLIPESAVDEKVGDGGSPSADTAGDTDTDADGDSDSGPDDTSGHGDSDTSDTDTSTDTDTGTPPPPDLFTDVAVGRDHTCGLHESGLVTCWGDAPTFSTTDTYVAIVAGTANGGAGTGMTCGIDSVGIVACSGITAPGGTYAAVALAQGDDFGVTLTATGSAANWGDISGRVDTEAAPSSTFTAVGTGSVAECGLVGGAIACWGSDQDGEQRAPTGTDYTAISVGMFDACALHATGIAACWGAWQTDHWPGSTPTPTMSLSTVSVGYDVACGIKVSDSTLTCWGSDVLGSGVLTGAPAGTYTRVTVGQEHACAVATDGTISCWGLDEYGEVSMTTAP